MTGYELLEATQRSIAQMRSLGYNPTRIRMHPLDAETIIAMRKPELANKRLNRLFDLEVIVTYEARLGEPVAEYEWPWEDDE